MYLFNRHAHLVRGKGHRTASKRRSAVDCTPWVLKEANYDASAVQRAQHLRTLLAERLERQGVEQAQMSGFFRELTKLMSEFPDVSLPAVNARLHYLGWTDVTLDYHSMQLAVFCLGDR